MFSFSNVLGISHNFITVTEKMGKRPSLSDPEFNIREIAKQMLLLEDHLNDEEKFCHDCIRKHLMMVEALAEESMTLDGDGIWLSVSRKMANKSRRWIERFSDGGCKFAIAREVRAERKKLVEMVFDPRVGRA